MKSKLIFLVIILVTGCVLFPYDDFRYSPVGLDATLLVSYNLIQYTPDEITYEINLASFNYYNDLYYEASSYHVEGPGTFNVLEIDGMERTVSPPSSTIFLIDQSGSYTEIDPHNLRSKIINKFLDDFSPADSHLLGGFSSNGLLIEQPVTYASSDFKSKWDNQEFLFELPKLTGGSSSLYDALNSALDKISSRNEGNKNIIALIHANDGGSLSTTNDLINKANANNIKIHLVILGTSTMPSTVWELSNRTNGMLAYCPEDLHMLTILNHFQRLVRSTVYISRLRISFKPDSGNVIPGAVYENQVKIIDPLSGYEFNPVIIQVKIP